MPWVVDTCLLIDIADADPQFVPGTARLLASHRSAGLVISPVTYVEMEAAFAAWCRYVRSRRLQRIAKRPMADILIGGFAEKFDGLLTRNEVDFRSVFPSLPIQVP